MAQTVLIMTCGQTDVQFAERDVKREFEKGQVGALHDRMQAQPDSWVLVDSPDLRGLSIREFPEAPWTICTPKLDAILAYLGEAVDSLLILETQRNIPTDPRFAGAVLEKRARSKGIASVRRCAYLGPSDRNLEDRDSPLDAIIRRDVVRRLEEAIRDALHDSRSVVVATTGGMPEVKVLVKELVRLHAPPGVDLDEVEVDDGARDSGQPDKAVSRKRVDPLEPIRLRKQSLSLIEKGNLIGAWGAVQHLDAQSHPWVLVVSWLRCFASSLPFETPLPVGALSALGHRRMAVRAALRVELALRAGDIPRAVHGTVAFFEAALWDMLGERIERSTDPKRRRYFRIKSGDVPSGDKLLRRGDGSEADRSRPFELKDNVDGVDWYWVYDGDGGPAARIAQYFLKSDHLRELDGTLRSARELRNDIAHNEPTPELMNGARTRMEEAHLWSTAGTFLGQPLVRLLLADLGETAPESLLNNLLGEVRRRLLLGEARCTV